MKLLIYPSLLFLCISLNAQNSGITVHEWGTFTTLCGSDGGRLSGLQFAEEAVPNFVYNLSMRYEVPDKGWTNPLSLKNVTVKMETPVLYFYADKATPFEIKVDFNGGLISQWYPQRTDGNPHILRDDMFGTPYVGDRSILDIAGSKGFINWKGTVLAPHTGTLTQPAINQHVWLAPRKTQSNLVNVTGTDPYGRTFNETEKYLFYRGIGNFDIPVKLNFDNKNRLNITNTGYQPLGYVMVYFKPYDSSDAEIWWSGSLLAGSTVNIKQLPGAGLTVNAEMEKFKTALMNEGLFEDEAAAMLSTWEKSYFESPGLKVFWVLPRNLTDKILPLEMTPAPGKLERVLVGRSEILTPKFEQHIYQSFKKSNSASSPFFYNPFINDRYAQAYYERYIAMQKTGDTLLYEAASETTFTVYPNPAINTLNIYKEGSEKGTIDVEITNSLGVSVHQHSITPDAYNDFTYYSLDCSQYTAGLYFVRITNGESVQQEKVVIRR